MTRLRTLGLDNASGQLKGFQGSTLDTIMGAPTPTTIEIDLGNTAHRGGHFDITGLSNLSTTRSVVITQAPGPYTGKGTLADEAEMDQAITTGYILDSVTIRCYWVGTGSMRGNVKFAYQLITNQ